MSVTVALACVAVLLATAVIGVAAGRRPAGRILVYGFSLAATAVAGTAAAVHLAAGNPDSSVILPLGLPWLGAHFRLDAL